MGCCRVNGMHINFFFSEALYLPTEPYFVFGSQKRTTKQRSDSVSEQVFWTMDWSSPFLL